MIIMWSRNSLLVLEVQSGHLFHLHLGDPNGKMIIVHHIYVSILVIYGNWFLRNAKYCFNKENTVFSFIIFIYRSYTGCLLSLVFICVFTTMLWFVFNNLSMDVEEISPVYKTSSTKASLVYEATCKWLLMQIQP